MYRSTRQRLKAYIICLESLPCRPMHNPRDYAGLCIGLQGKDSRGGLCIGLQGKDSRHTLYALRLCPVDLHIILHTYNASMVVETKARNLAKPIQTAAHPLIRERANRSLAAGCTDRRGVCGFPLCTARSQTGARLPSIAFRLERNAKDSSEIEFRPLLLPPSSDTV